MNQTSSIESSEINQSKTMSHCLLFNLPRDLYNEICSYWLISKDLGKLDIAMSNTEVRVLWLEQLKSKSIICT